MYMNNGIITLALLSIKSGNSKIDKVSDWLLSHNAQLHIQ